MRRPRLHQIYKAGLLLCLPLSLGLGMLRPPASQAQPVIPPAQLFGNRGGRQLIPADRLVALYGAPDMPVLGALGEQPLAASLTRAKRLAADYQPHMREHALPAIELIATVAAAEPTANGDYSRETDPARLLPWVNAARQAGVYVVLDLQPGTSNFLDQAKQYRNLLAYPNVGLALDPEWRLAPGQHHLVNIGSVSSAEVNRTADWLAGLTRSRRLPQKVLLLHQFRTSMIPDRSAVSTRHPELTIIAQMDGQGDQPTKLDTWQAITQGGPAALRYGWKNFYHKDTPLRSPADTMTLTPEPWYISYQ